MATFNEQLLKIVEDYREAGGTWPATKEQINTAKHLVPDDLVHRITASGTPAEAKAKVEEYKKRGCTCPILYPVGGNFKLLIDTFAQI